MLIKVGDAIDDGGFVKESAKPNVLDKRGMSLAHKTIISVAMNTYKDVLRKRLSDALDQVSKEKKFTKTLSYST